MSKRAVNTAEEREAIAAMMGMQDDDGDAIMETPPSSQGEFATRSFLWRSVKLKKKYLPQIRVGILRHSRKHVLWIFHPPKPMLIGCYIHSNLILTLAASCLLSRKHRRVTQSNGHESGRPRQPWSYPQRPLLLAR